jgi:hypothetical protein
MDNLKLFNDKLKKLESERREIQEKLMDNRKKMADIEKKQELSSIAAVLANYAYNTGDIFKPVENRLTIGKLNKFRYDPINSLIEDGISFWRENDGRVVVSLRGTNSLDDIL